MSADRIPEEILPADAATDYRYGACDACGRPPDWFAPSVPQAEAEESWEESWAVCEACKTRWLVGLIVNGWILLPNNVPPLGNPFAGVLQFGDLVAAAAGADEESAPYDDPDRWRAEYREVSGDPPPWVVAWFKAQQDAEQDAEGCSPPSTDQIGVTDDADARHPAQKLLFPRNEER
jgi:hypothetical protein